MAKTVNVQMLLTNDEHKMLMRAVAKKQMETGERISVSKFLRDTLFEVWDNNSPPSVPDNEQENVSTQLQDTFSEKEKDDPFNFDLSS